eukprot:INCI19811.1.p1 GENE.INCI19811.1~~INCI19811.1.p1  ORF type:complete len:707 (-),score=85.83 INCI19811.1:105-2036(-)
MQRLDSFALSRSNSFPNRDLFGVGDGCDAQGEGQQNCPAPKSLTFQRTSSGFYSQQRPAAVDAECGAVTTENRRRTSSVTPIKQQVETVGDSLRNQTTATTSTSNRANRFAESATVDPAAVRPGIDEYVKPKPDPTAFEERGWGPDGEFGSQASRATSSSSACGDRAATETLASPTNHSPLLYRQQPPDLVRTRKIPRSSSLTQTKILLDMHPTSPGSLSERSDSSGQSRSPGGSGTRPPSAAGGQPARGSRRIQFHREFQILSRIGCGNFSEVYQVRSLRSRGLYAVKKSLRPFQSRRDRENYEKEAYAYFQLGPACPQIIKYFRAWNEGGHFFVQMELCARGNLASFLKSLDCPVPELSVWNWVRQLALALRHMHAKGLVHMDTKPENVFLTSDGCLKLGDLGTASQYGHGESGIEGDKRYMAPELLLNSTKTPAVDIFSLGITVLEITQRHGLPREGQSWKLLRKGKLPPCPRQYSPKLATFIVCLMHPDSRRRPTADIILRHPQVADSQWHVDDFIRITPLKEDNCRSLNRCDSAVMWQPDLGRGAPQGGSAGASSSMSLSEDEADLDSTNRSGRVSPAAATTPRSHTPQHDWSSRPDGATTPSSHSTSFTTPRTVPVESAARSRSRSALVGSAPTTPR